MNALILYDDLTLATQAKDLLRRAMQNADEINQWNILPWRVDMAAPIHRPDVSPLDAADAHLIVLALRSQSDLTSTLLEWLEEWATHRLVTDAALAVVNSDTDDAGGRSTASTALRELAWHHGLNFISGNEDEDESSAMLRDLHEREVVVSLTLQQIIDGMADCQRGRDIRIRS